MPVWEGLGVNYAGSQANWEADIAYFQSIGLRNIRVSLQNPTIPWTVGSTSNAGSYAYWRLCAQTFAEAGFWVTWGDTATGSLTATSWTAYATAILAEATYCQSIGLAQILGDFEMGNELEELIDNSTLTQPELIANLSSLAQQIKEISGWNCKVSYGSFDKSNTMFENWIAAGTLGYMDTLSIHGYPNINVSGQYTYSVSYAGNTSRMAAVAAAYPGQIYVSEFNLDSNNFNINALTYENQVRDIRTLYSFIKSIVPIGIMFTWVNFLDEFDYPESYSMKFVDGSFSPMWDIFLNDNGRRTFVP